MGFDKQLVKKSAQGNKVQQLTVMKGTLNHMPAINSSSRRV
jgi:hypothetical protein